VAARFSKIKNSKNVYFRWRKKPVVEKRILSLAENPGNMIDFRADLAF